MGKTKKNVWKPVGINLENANELICFEQLTDYKIVRGEIGESNHSDDEDVPRKKQKRKKKPSNSQKLQKNAVKRKNSNIDSSVPHKKTKNAVCSEKQMPEVAADVINSEPDLEHVDSWKQFSLPEPILKALAVKKFERPTEIQVCWWVDTFFI